MDVQNLRNIDYIYDETEFVAPDAYLYKYKLPKWLWFQQRNKVLLLSERGVREDKPEKKDIQISNIKKINYCLKKVLETCILPKEVAGNELLTVGTAQHADFRTMASSLWKIEDLANVQQI